MKSVSLTVRFMDTESDRELLVHHTTHDLRTSFVRNDDGKPDINLDASAYPGELKLISHLIEAIRATHSYPVIRYKRIEHPDGTVMSISSLTHPEEFKKP